MHLAAGLQALVPGAVRWPRRPPTGSTVLVASYDDLRLLGGDHHPILFEHGVGQSYGGTTQTGSAAGYAGGLGRERVTAFLHPNEQAAARDRAVYPDAHVEVVGYPRLPALQRIPVPPTGIRPVVAFTFHWHAPLCPESASGFGYWWPAIRALAEAGDVEVLGHGHPRLLDSMGRVYERYGIEVVPQFEQVVARANVLAFDNTSAGYEFAAVRGPVVVLDNPEYRRDVEHGLRFWDCADIGPRISDPVDLPDAVDRALAGPWPGADRLLARVFPAVEDPAGTAAHAVLRVVNQLQRVSTSV